MPAKGRRKRIQIENHNILKLYYLELYRKSAPSAFARTASGWAGTTIAIDDPTLGQIIRRHFDANGVAHDRPDAETPHPASRVSDDTMIILEQDAEAPVGKNFIDLAVEG